MGYLEVEYADYMGSQYYLGMSSCGSALKSIGIEERDLVLCNAFTLAPVPGAIEYAGEKPVFVEITDDLVIDLLDLEKKGSRFSC